ncbi:hypothetical protein KAX17_00825 [Candidatus Bipolaricaulota bacterium]|nr:hypothetical protein [Candidatus Bipolaricaulota bacterium]
MASEGGVILDSDYADALLSVAIRDGYAQKEPLVPGNEHLHKNIAFKSQNKKEVQTALELALLCGDVHLHDCSPIAKPAKLEKEGVVRSWIPKGQLVYEPLAGISEPKRLERTRSMKPLVINHLIRKFQEAHATSRAFRNDSKEEQRRHAEWYVPEFYEFFAWSYAGYIEEGIKRSDLRPIYEMTLGKEDPVAWFAKEMLPQPSEDTMSGWQFDMMLMASELSSMISLYDRSAEIRIPFVSTRIEVPEESARREIEAGHKELEAIHEAYTLCLVPFKEEVKYAPIVRSIDELLRLREKKEIRRFREVLDNWKEAILNKEKNVQERIRSDIAKANAELKNLGKWRKVERWFYYAALPAAFVPQVSGAVTIASFVIRTHIERTERLHDWVCIGR